jgi:hypothetical protein
LITVAGMLSFFLMIFDSLRKSKAHIRNSFGILRFNTRLNFYLFASFRVKFISEKSIYIFRNRAKSLFIKKINFENFETTAYTLNFFKKLKKRVRNDSRIR